MSAVESACGHREVERIERRRADAQRGAFIRRDGLVDLVQARQVAESMDPRGLHGTRP